MKKRMNKLRHQAYHLLCFLCGNGDLTKLEKLLCSRHAKGRSSGTDGLGMTVLNWHHRSSPLHIATAAGQVKIVQILIRLGADLDIVDSTRQTPIHLAASLGHMDIVRDLLAGGASVDANIQAWDTVCVFIAKAVQRNWAITADEIA